MLNETINECINPSSNNILFTDNFNQNPQQVFRIRDEQFIQIQKLIEAKERMIQEKQKKIKSIKKQNHFLEIVLNDYKKYDDYILQQKRDQIKALNTLNEYINELTISGKLTNNNLKDAKEEQKKILNEIDKIKNKLDEAIGRMTETKNILEEKNKM